MSLKNNSSAEPQETECQGHILPTQGDSKHWSDQNQETATFLHALYCWFNDVIVKISADC